MASVAELRQKLLPDGEHYPQDAWDSLVDALDRDLVNIKVVIQLHYETSCFNLTFGPKTQSNSDLKLKR